MKKSPQIWMKQKKLVMDIPCLANQHKCTSKPTSKPKLGVSSSLFVDQHLVGSSPSCCEFRQPKCTGHGLRLGWKIQRTDKDRDRDCDLDTTAPKRDRKANPPEIECDKVVHVYLFGVATSSCYIYCEWVVPSLIRCSPSWVWSTGC